MIDSPFRSGDPKRPALTALVAMHEAQLKRSLSHSHLVFGSAAHPQLSIEPLRRLHVLFTYDAVADAARAGLEPPVHRAPRMKRLAELHLWPMEYLDRVAVGIVQFEDFEHAALFGFLICADAKLHARRRSLNLPRGEFLV